MKYHTWPEIHYGKVTKHNKTLHIKGQKCQPFPSRWSQDCKKQTRQYNKDKDKTQITKTDPQKKRCFWMVSKMLEGLNMSNGTHHKLNSNVDQDTEMSCLHEKFLTFRSVISHMLCYKSRYTKEIEKKTKIRTWQSILLNTRAKQIQQSNPVGPQTVTT